MRRHIRRFIFGISMSISGKILKLASSEEPYSLLLHQVSQTYMVAPLDLHFSILYDVLKKHVAEDADYKVSEVTKFPAYILGTFSVVISHIIFQVIIFCTTAMVTKLVAEVLSQLKLNIREIHSRKSQSARTKVSDEFRKSKGLILVSSDVSARGVDYPDVTLVIQVCTFFFVLQIILL